MSGKIRNSDIEELKSRVNIADVVGEYVSLKNASAGSLKGLCPFHDEKSPSFNVRPLQGFYHCFGCGEGGDVYKFVQKMESLTFTEAVEKLASRAGFTLTYEEGGASIDTGSRARILEANQAAAAYFQSQLESAEASTGREFLKGRGFDKDAASMFAIGYAPKGWSNLFDHLTKLGFTKEELVNAGLITLSERGGFDKFRGRLIWPIKDATGSVIGFGARKLYDDDQGPKYLNSADTLVYHKSQVLYGIDLAKKDITKKHQVVVVEGYTDVMACHLAGITTAVATCGTAFGDEHIRILNRMLASQDGSPSEVIFTFDPDAAGQKAAMRAFADSFKFKDANTFVAVGPDGLDPCDLRSNKGDEAVRFMIEQKRPLFEFAIKNKIDKFDLNTLEGRVGAARAAAPIIAAIIEPAMRNAYTRLLMEWVPLDENQIQNIVLEASKTARAEAVSALNMDKARPADATSPAVAEPEPQYPPVNLNEPRNRVERAILEVLVQLGSRCDAETVLRITIGAFSHPQHVAIASAITKNIQKLASQEWLNSLAQDVPEPLHRLLRELAASTLPVKLSDEGMVNRFVQGVLNTGLNFVLQDEKVMLKAALNRTNRETDPKKFVDIQGRLLEIDKEIQALK